MKAIIYAADPLLTVYINRDQASAPVTYNYDDLPGHSTVFQTADMPMDDQAAGKVVSDWLDDQQ